MKNRIELAKLATLNAREKIGFVQVIGNFTIHQVQKLVTFGQVVYGQHIGNTALVQRLHQIAAD